MKEIYFLMEMKQIPIGNQESPNEWKLENFSNENQRISRMKIREFPNYENGRN